jgi:hypothetical protein
MILLGCTPKGRHTEQHDIFFGIGTSLSDLKIPMTDFWPEAEGRIHIDAWREVTSVDGYSVNIVLCEEAIKNSTGSRLFFLNLGGYKRNEFEEYHYKILTVAENKGLAVQKAKQTSFYIHTGFEVNASSHIDDKYGIDVDDVYQIEDILPAIIKEKYSIQISRDENILPDELFLGYLKLDKI